MKRCPICRGLLEKPERCVDLRCTECERWWADPARTERAVTEVLERLDPVCERRQELEAIVEETPRAAALLEVHIEHCVRCS